MNRKSSEVKILAMPIAVIGVVLITYSLLAYQNASNSYYGMMGMGSSTNSLYYGLTNMILAIVGAIMLASGVLYVVMRVDYEPVSYPQEAFVPVARSASVQRPEVNVGAIARSTDPPEVKAAPPVVSVSEVQNNATATIAESKLSALNEENYLILRLLSGDERTMFRAIMDAGGEGLQKNLIATTKMSEAKVSRVIDRLVEKGVIVKERNGMTNKVRIQIDK